MTLLFILGLIKLKVAFLIGNEGNGLSDHITSLATKKIKIPMKYINSINVVPSAIYFYDIYVVSVQTQENGPKTLLLMDDDEEGLEVVADIRN